MLLSLDPDLRQYDALEETRLLCAPDLQSTECPDLTSDTGEDLDTFCTETLPEVDVFQGSVCSAAPTLTRDMIQRITPCTELPTIGYAYDGNAPHTGQTPTADVLQGIVWEGLDVEVPSSNTLNQPMALPAAPDTGINPPPTQAPPWRGSGDFTTALSGPYPFQVCSSNYVSMSYNIDTPAVTLDAADTHSFGSDSNRVLHLDGYAM